MKAIAAVCAYNKPQLVDYWLKLWPGLDPKIPLAVIHPNDGGPRDDITSLCNKAPVCELFVSRENNGADICSFEDFVKGMYAWDVCVWMTDDCLPMRKDFLSKFLDPFENLAVGMTAFAFEPASTGNRYEHARTVAFAIRRDVALRLEFPPRLQYSKSGDRQACFEFEHGENNMYLQVKRMGHRVKPCIGTLPAQDGYAHWYNNQDFMWDSGHQAAPDLLNKFKEVHGL